MKIILFFLIVGILLFTIYGSLNLSITDFQKKDVCPKVLGIPACYIVFLFFALAMLAHVLKGPFQSDWWYYGFMLVPFLLALSGTLAELSGKVVCPRTPRGTPMCFISLGFCTLLILLKVAETKWV